ncbi:MULTISPECIES: FecR family protein [Sphingobacterium]|uniref:FecR domain-containing protein n=1 Tax=Sphingobacterium kitahiroshimense TaxID=470446 RepID=A0ABV0BZE0_9SPHI|nr:FecR domain-containing protein [Sphingobacterium sp. IITKGP-BTPF85]KKX49404.1 hypothetical protein L950_0215840 [Sphingobacterium sp. IITKGP-BTPF85]
MSTSKTRIRVFIINIFNKYLSGKTSENEDQLIEKIYDRLDIHDLDHIDYESINKDIKQQVDAAITRKIKISNRKKHYQIAVAASVLFVLSLGALFLYQGKDTIMSLSRSKHTARDFPQLTLNREHRINLLDSLPVGSTLHKKGEGHILDLTHMERSQKVELIEINNPSETPFTVVLKDQTKVSLNKHSSVSFQSNFGIHSREVMAVGEVDFDVSKQQSQDKWVPFTVRTKLQTIEVLGTQFHVSTTIPGEENVLLKEGSIRLAHNHSDGTVILKPGDKAFLQEIQPKIMISSQSSKAKIDSWRRGEFYFENEKLRQVMDEIGTWYGKSIEMSDDTGAKTLTGIFTRYNTIEDVLHMIALTNSVDFKEKKGVIYVTVK